MTRTHILPELVHDLTLVERDTYLLDTLIAQALPLVQDGPQEDEAFSKRAIVLVLVCEWISCLAQIVEYDPVPLGTDLLPMLDTPELLMLKASLETLTLDTSTILQNLGQRLLQRGSPVEMPYQLQLLKGVSGQIFVQKVCPTPPL